MIDAGVLVVGARAIGGVAAAKLAAKLAGEVRRVAVLDANRDPGLVIDALGGERRVELDAHADPEDFDDPFDFVLVLRGGSRALCLARGLRRWRAGRVPGRA